MGIRIHGGWPKPTQHVRKVNGMTTPDADAMGLVALLPCPACDRSISTDSEACPGCGRVNDWVHPKLARVVEHLRAHYADAVFEVRGHQMVIKMTTQNLRSEIGSVFVVLSMVLLIGGLFSTTLMGLATLCMVIGVCLTLFGLSAFTHHTIQIDVRQGNPVTAVSDTKVWADVITMLR